MAKKGPGVATNVVVWSQVEAGVAVLAACLPTLRPLLFGHAAESLIRSIRSLLSLSSRQSSKRHGSDVENLTATNREYYEMANNGVCGSSQATVDTRVTGVSEDRPIIPQNKILKQNEFSYKDIRAVGDRARDGMV